MSAPRFLRGKRAPRKQRSFWRPVVTLSLQLAALGLLVWAGWSAWHALTDEDRFPVETVEIQGLERANLANLEARLASAHGKNLLTLDLDPLRRAAQADPWIQEALLKRDLPNTLSVRVIEKIPVATTRIGPTFYHLDAGGELITEIPGGELPDGPWLVGLDKVAPEVRSTRLRAGVTAIEAIRDGHETFLSEIQRIDLADPRRVVLQLRDHSELWLPMERYPENLDRYFHLREQIAAVAGPVRYADLRWEGQIAVMPTGGGGR